jgi:hypothetical protein
MAHLSDRNASKIMDVLEEVFIDGVASIPVRQMLYIYGQERMTKGIWRDVIDRWNRLCEDRGYDMVPELLVAYHRDHPTICFAFGREFDQEIKDWGKPFLNPIPQLVSGAGTDSAEAA